MSNIPTKDEKPKGLHARYVVRKIIGWKKEGFIGLRAITKATDPGSEYFIMRLDEGGSDIEHIKACRIGVHAYADAIEHHLPELAKDLKQRYPLLPLAIPLPDKSKEVADSIWSSYWEKINKELHHSGGVNPQAYKLGFLDAINLPPTNTVKDGWISVETLPDDNKDYQVWEKGSLVPSVAHYLSKKYFIENYKDENYMEEGWYYSHGYVFDDYLPEIPLSVTHWQPLPQPPTQPAGAKPIIEK